jgi:hypothetical protein
MAVLFYKNRNYGVGIITFDLILSENHSFNNNVTRYNVEDGSDISDHIQNDLETGQVTGFISNFSIYDEMIMENKAQIAYDTLRELWKKRELVDIYTVLQVYEQVAITNISVSRDSGSGESLIADFSFQEFNKVKLKEVKLDIVVNNVKLDTKLKNYGKHQGTKK